LAHGVVELCAGSSPVALLSTRRAAFGRDAHAPREAKEATGPGAPAAGRSAGGQVGRRGREATSQTFGSGARPAPEAAAAVPRARPRPGRHVRREACAWQEAGRDLSFDRAEPPEAPVRTRSFPYRPSRKPTARLPAESWVQPPD
jgi:hypothetical protein